MLYKHTKSNEHELQAVLRIKTKVPRRLHVVRAGQGATRSRKESVEANFGGSSAKMLAKHAVLLVGNH